MWTVQKETDQIRAILNRIPNKNAIRRLVEGSGAGWTDDLDTIASRFYLALREFRGTIRSIERSFQLGSPPVENEILLFTHDLVVCAHELEWAVEDAVCAALNDFTNPRGPNVDVIVELTREPLRSILGKTRAWWLEFQ